MINKGFFLVALLAGLAGCSSPADQGSIPASQGQLPSRAHGNSTAGRFATALLTEDFETGYSMLSSDTQSKVSIATMKQMWYDNTGDLGANISLIDTDTGQLPSSSKEYGFETNVPRSKWKSWEFATISGEYPIDIRVLVVEQNGESAIEHFEFGLSD